MLADTIKQAEARIRSIIRRHWPGATVFSFGAVDIDPRHLAIWVTTPTDAERDRLQADTALQEEFRAALRNVGYPQAAVPQVGFAFQSQQSVDRDHGGNWWHAVR